MIWRYHLRVCKAFRGSLLTLITLFVANVSFAEKSEADWSEFYVDPVAIYGRVARYEVFRNEKKVGSHTVEFSGKDEDLQVKVSSSLKVRYLGVPVYRYAYTAVENWRDGKLHSIESRIRDNYKKERLITARATGRVLEITDRGVSRSAPSVNFPSNHWHPAVVRERRVFHTLHGKVHRVKIQDLGPDKVQLSGKDQYGAQRTAVITGNRYRYSGGFSADVWYDEEDRWVRLVFNADDGSRIDYRCVTCLPHPE